jgi:N,N'-diacetyllegionaminate synthase
MTKCFIIAEIGVNHDGDVERARRMIDVAKECGADCVKFQTFRADALATSGASKAEYQTRTTSAGESQRDMLRRLELKFDDYAALMTHAERIGVEFMSSPFDVESARLLVDLGLRRLKIPSGEITNLPLLRYCAGVPDARFILSTGMATLGEIESALAVLGRGRPDLAHVTVLHCNTEYPTPVEDVNLLAMETLRRAFQVDIGYSDHTDGVEISIAAVALGATLIEKHFTLDRGLAGPDHAASLEPRDFALMVNAIRNVERARGSAVKRPSPSEWKNRSVARKSIVAARHIGRGECFSDQNLTAKRPGTGISPMSWDNLLGRPATRDYEPDELIEP